MTERQPDTTIEKCTNCPNRSRMSSILAKLSTKNVIVSGCEGPTTIAHGVIETRTLDGNDPLPNESASDWNVTPGPATDDSSVEYSRVHWDSENACGREAIVPREGEVVHPLGDPIWTSEDGSRHAAFIKGSDKEVANHRATLAMIDFSNDNPELS